MTFFRYCFLLALAGCLAGGAQAQTQNPVVNLRVDDLPLTQIAARLGEASGASFDLQVEREIAERRESFAWERVGLGQALRELCERYGLTCQPLPGGAYRLQAPAAGRPPRAAPPPRVATPDGYEVLVQTVGSHQIRTVNHLGDSPDQEANTLNLQIVVRVPVGEEVSLAGLQDLRAEDDLGNRFTLPLAGGRNARPGRFPDEQVLSVQLSQRDPRATRLQWLSAGLWAYRARRELQVSIPLPMEERVVVRETEDLLLALADWQRLEPVAGLPGELGPFTSGGYTGRVRLRWRAGRLQPRNIGTWLAVPEAVGASGTRYGGNVSSGASSGGDQEGGWAEGQVFFPGVPEEVVRLEWNFVLLEEAEQATEFRLTNIPLPTGPDAPPPGDRPPPPDPDPPTTGWLIGEVRLAGEAALGGTLSYGVAPRQGDGWGPIRWREARVNALGEARLTELPPGEYRVLRRYQPAPDRPGEWRNGELEVTVTAGEETRLPPLEFVPGASS